MKNLALILIMSLFAFSVHAQSGEQNSTLLNGRFVNLRGKEAITVFVNNTPDTLKLEYAFFNWLPYMENKDVIKLPPGKNYTLKLQFNFPDLIRINNWVVYNSPGGKVVCHINANGTNPVLTFSVSLASENIYYNAYAQFLGGIDQEGRSFYTVSDRLSNWNQFPNMADSITQLRLKFLETYQQPLPVWFKEHEKQRLIFHKYYRLYNALVAKEYHTGKKVPVNDKYYDFENELKQTKGMVLNETYLSCIGFYCLRQGKMAAHPQKDPVIWAADSILKGTDIGDVLKMRTLGSIYRNNRVQYDSIFSTISFRQPERKKWIDSLIQTRLGAPYIGKKPPALLMTDVNGKAATLADFSGKTIILNFWAVWCAPCITEFPFESSLYQKYKEKGLVIINVCVDSEKEAWLQVTNRHKLSTINLFTSKAGYNKLSKFYNLGSLPRSILINCNGYVIDNYLRRASTLTDTDIQALLTR